MHGDTSVSVPVMMLIVFGAAKLLAEVFDRFRQPAILGEIIAGVVIGPSVLNWVAPNSTIETLAELGVMFLLFRVGLEVNPRDLWKVRGTALAVATMGVVAPMAAGWYFMRSLGSSTPESLFVGASLVATSVGVTAHVLGQRGLLSIRASQVILAAAVIDDILGLIVLAVVSGVSQGHADLLEIAVNSAMALGFTAVVACWGPSAARILANVLHRRLRAGEVQFNLAMVVLLLLAVVAMRTGMAAIVGAFLAGMMLSETAERRIVDLTRGISELLVPFFLASIGLHMDLSLFRDLHMLWVVAAIFVLAVISKLIGCGAGAVHLGARDMMRVGLGMVPRGEVGMVVARYGLAAGIVSAKAYGAVVAMAVTTTMVTPLLLRFAFDPAESGEPEPEGALAEGAGCESV
jgi:Kef-type K+ transport system membrane component KefB